MSRRIFHKITPRPARLNWRAGRFFILGIKLFFMTASKLHWKQTSEINRKGYPVDVRNDLSAESMTNLGRNRTT